MIRRTVGSHRRVASLRILHLACLAALVAPAPARADESGTVAGEIVARPTSRAGVVVFLDKVPGTFRPPSRPARMEQRGMKFVPHVLAVLAGTTVAFGNDDALRHNVFSPDHETYDLGTWPEGESRVHTFAAPGVYHQLCRVHPEMGAVIVVLENPYFAVTGSDGKFRIDKVPPGRYALKTWAEKGATVATPVTVVAGGTVEARLELVR